MPNVGQPSRACHACRDRRVKCDLTRPECHRCLRRGHACPGYRDELALRFRSESIASYQSQINKSRRKRTKSNGANASSSGSASLPSQSGSRRPPQTQDRLLRWITPRVAPVSPPKETWEDHLVPLVMNQFSYGQAQSIYTFIPQYVSQAGDKSPLQLACRAVGAAHLVHTASFSHSALHPAVIYSDAITTINSALQNPEACTSDGTLLAVWLLSLYEFLWGSQGAPEGIDMPSGWNVHASGMLELMRMRGPQQFSTVDGRNLFWMVYNTVQIQQTISGQECDRDTLSWIQQLYKQSTPPEYMILRTATFTYHCINIGNRIRRLLDKGDLDLLLSHSPSILRDVDGVETVTYPFPPNNPIYSHNICPPQQPYIVPDHMGLLYIGVHTYQCFFRMQLSWRVLKFLRQCAAAPSCSQQQRALFDRLRARSVEDLRALANKVLSMLARSFGISSLARLGQLQQARRDSNSSFLVRWSDAIRILPSLRLISACSFMLKWQREAAIKALDFMKKELGVMHISPTV